MGLGLSFVVTVPAKSQCWTLSRHVINGIRMNECISDCICEGEETGRLVRKLLKIPGGLLKGKDRGNG